MQMILPINSQLSRVHSLTRSISGALKPLLFSSVTLLALYQSIAVAQNKQGTFLNPPRVGERITAVTGSVVCFKELDAVAMVRTGFFSNSCETFTDSTTLIAESITSNDAGEGLVLMVQTTFKDKPAWVPIPWHDWL